jgi:hypothetical protein
MRCPRELSWMSANSVNGDGGSGATMKRSVVEGEVGGEVGVVVAVVMMEDGNGEWPWADATTMAEVG